MTKVSFSKSDDDRDEHAAHDGRSTRGPTLPAVEMTMRDHFAAAAMSAFGTRLLEIYSAHPEAPTEIARRCYAAADALIKVSTERPVEPDKPIEEAAKAA